MVGRAQIGNAILKRIAAADFTLPRVSRQALWGCAAAAALILASLSGLTDAGAERAAVVFSSLHLRSLRADRAARRPFDAESATRQLAQAMGGLAADRDRLATRLSALEHSMDEMTGSIGRRIEAAKGAGTQAVAPWPSSAPPVPELQETVAMVSPAAPPADAAITPESSMAAASSPALDPAAPAPLSVAYGADIGGAPSIKSLHAHWTVLHAAHQELFEGLRPAVTLRENPRSNRTELRLVVGPFPNAEAAAQLCASLAVFRQTCRPTMFDGQLALQ